MFRLKVFALAAILSVALVNAADTALCGAHGISLKADNGLSPCDIASLMVGKGVMPEDSPFPDLESEGLDSYPIPTPDEADDLRCNMVFYNLVSGCSACQLTTNTWASWDDWTSHCKSQSSVGYIASTMPYDTPIPNWAFTDAIATGGTFNATAAKLVAENLFDVPDTVFNVKSDATSSNSTTASAASGSCASSGSSSSVNTGAIAGGTIGGFVGGAVLGALGVFIAARKKGTKKTDDGQHSVHSQETQDTIVQEKSRIAGLA
ncbi:hypothetical protein L227DRAFT_599278 [Lentinus tigrinus ALCF2SS1-6]|uniref:Uncharacterized protein n=1 Tax=Lentinus tigrinus ALCF2SS1-6 TaxID=1328759 RepID=A0A5C2SGS7_9APHY|nr:hypothetical protein L227DRAFT_599278 [Lentinus tigrinus ALCF2SS1-6]